MLKEVLHEWEWQGSVDELLQYWFSSDFNLDPEIMTIVQKIRKLGYPAYLATDQEKHRMKYIWDDRGLNEKLDGKFVSCEIGFHKSDPRFFDTIINALDIVPAQIIFFDDSQSKVDSAKSVGISAHLYTDVAAFRNIVREMFGVEL